MPNKKKKYNSRFPPARIKKIMQTDEDVGKVAAAVPVIISRALELFIESLIMKASHTTQNRHAKTLTTAHIKQTIEAEKKFDFLRDLVVNIADHQTEEEPPEGNGPGSNSAETGNKKLGRIVGTRGPRKRKDSLTTSHASSDNNNIRRSKHREEEEEEEEEDNNNDDDDEETDDAESEEDQEQQDLQDQNNQTEEEEATTSSCLRGDDEVEEESPVPSSNGFQPTTSAPNPGYHSLGQPSSQFKVPPALFSTSLSRLFLPPGQTQGQEEDDDYDT